MKPFNYLTRVRGHTIWTAGLGPESVVVDAGAHRGEFSRTLIEKYGCKCYLIEANPTLAAALHVLNAHAVVPAALSARDGRARFIMRDNPEAGGIIPWETDVTTGQTVDVESISLPTLMRRLALPQIDLLKLDIEGAEFNFIAETQDVALSSIGQITVEFHDFLPMFHRHKLFGAARARLQQLGFVCCLIAFRTHGDVLFLNRQHFQFGPATAFCLSAGARWFLRFAS